MREIVMDFSLVPRHSHSTRGKSSNNYNMHNKYTNVSISDTINVNKDQIDSNHKNYIASTGVLALPETYGIHQTILAIYPDFWLMVGCCSTQTILSECKSIEQKTEELMQKWETMKPVKVCSWM